MSRYIDADKLMRQVENLPQKEGKVFRISVYNLITFGCTADVVEVVRCKDCKYKDSCNQYVLHYGDECELAFCSYGEKKDNERT